MSGGCRTYIDCNYQIVLSPARARPNERGRSEERPACDAHVSQPAGQQEQARLPPPLYPFCFVVQHPMPEEDTTCQPLPHSLHPSLRSGFVFVSRGKLRTDCGTAGMACKVHVDLFPFSHRASFQSFVAEEACGSMEDGVRRLCARLAHTRTHTDAPVQGIPPRGVSRQAFSGLPNLPRGRERDLQGKDRSAPYLQRRTPAGIGPDAADGIWDASMASLFPGASSGLSQTELYS